MTEKLYERDAYCREFTARVLTCEETNGAYRVVLDRTAFFPEGGGQAADVGTINGIRVLDVQCEGETIVHTTEAALCPGDAVTGVLDWELRFSRMQSHAGEHIVSGVVHALYGYDNVGFHMSEAVMTVDVSGPLTQADIDNIELEANRAVYRNASITASYPSAEELARLPYRSKLERDEGLRIITIEGIDCCACCAPHPSRTGEIGLIKLLSHCPHKQGTRIEMLAGIHALRDYIGLNAANKQLMGLLSAPRHAVTEAVGKQSELVAALRSDNQRLARKAALGALAPVTVDGAVYAVTRELSFDELRYCANTLTDGGAATCVLLSQTADTEYLYVVSSKGGDVRALVKTLNETFGGKGGGKPEYAQGKLSAASQDELRHCVEKLLQKNG